MTNYQLMCYSKYKRLLYRCEKSENYYDDVLILRHYVKSLLVVFPSWTDDFREMERLLLNIRQKKKRIKKALADIFLNGFDVCFLTLTFNNDSLKLNERYLRECVSKLLNDVSFDFLANVDYGKKNGRMHFHAVIDLKPGSVIEWKFGFFKLVRVRNTSGSIRKLSNYICKFTNHAGKLTAGRVFRKFNSMRKIEELSF